MKRFKKILYSILLAYIFCYHFVPYNQIDPEALPYLNTFRVSMWDKCTTKQTKSTWQISIKIKDNINWFNRETVGICHPRLFGFDITLRKDFWESVHESGRRQLLYHELLHCYLNIDHESGTIMDAYTIPFSEEETERQLNYFLEKTCGH